MRASRREQHGSAALPTRSQARFRDSAIMAGRNGGDRSRQNNGCKGEHPRGIQLNFMARPPSRRGRYARVMPVNCELVHTHSSTLITPACGVRQREPAAFEDHAARVKRSGGADLARECLKDRAVHEELPILMALQLVAVKRSGHKLPGASCSTTCCKRAIAPIGVMSSQPSIATAASVSHSLRRCCR